MRDDVTEFFRKPPVHIKRRKRSWNWFKLAAGQSTCVGGYCKLQLTCGWLSNLSSYCGYNRDLVWNVRFSWIPCASLFGHASCVPRHGYFHTSLVSWWGQLEKKKTPPFSLAKHSSLVLILLINCTWLWGEHGWISSLIASVKKPNGSNVPVASHHGVMCYSNKLVEQMKYVNPSNSTTR